MSALIDVPEDPFEAWLVENGYEPQDEAVRTMLFASYVYDSTGWDGQQFSLTEDERHWIARANETIEWLRLALATNTEESWTAVRTTLEQLRPIPKSLEID